MGNWTILFHGLRLKTMPMTWKWENVRVILFLLVNIKQCLLLVWKLKEYLKMFWEECLSRRNVLTPILFCGGNFIQKLLKNYNDKIKKKTGKCLSIFFFLI